MQSEAGSSNERTERPQCDASHTSASESKGLHQSDVDQEEQTYGSD